MNDVIVFCVNTRHNMTFDCKHHCGSAWQGRGTSVGHENVSATLVLPELQPTSGLVFDEFASNEERLRENSIENRLKRNEQHKTSEFERN